MLGVQALGTGTERRWSRVGEARVSQGEAAADTSDQDRAVAMPVDANMPSAAARAAAISADEREAWLVLVTVPGLGPVTFASLLASYGSARAVLEAASSPAAGPLGPELAARVAVHAAQSGQLVRRVRDLGLEIVTLEDAAYPPRLRSVEMPPPLLFLRGDPAALAGEHAVAVVGTRRPTDRGRSVAGWIASAISRAGGVVVSGLALGIDGAAHAAAVAEGLPTVAVLGGGHARLFPRAHERLAEAIVEAGGAVVAELPPDTSPTRGTFPRRNRLISGLADATVVVEAGRKSGALITGGWALEQGRDCFVVPGPLDSPASAGCHAFLREFRGEVQLVAGIPELLEDLRLADDARGDAAGAAGFVRTSAADDVAATSEVGQAEAARAGRPSGRTRGAGVGAVLASLSDNERAVAEVLAGGPATADRLALATQLPVAAVLGALTLLELRGFVSAGYGRYFPAGPLLRWPPGTTAARR